MANYAPTLGLDKNGTPIENTRPLGSLVAVYQKDNWSVSSVITLTHDTTYVEMVTSGGPALMRWVRTGDGSGAATSVTSSNFTHAVPNDAVGQFIVPREAVIADSSSVQGANRGLGLYQRLAVKSAATSSVFLSEYGF